MKPDDAFNFFNDSEAGVLRIIIKAGQERFIRHYICRII